MKLMKIIKKNKYILGILLISVLTTTVLYHNGNLINAFKAYLIYKNDKRRYISADKFLKEYVENTSYEIKIKNSDFLSLQIKNKEGSIVSLKDLCDSTRIAILLIPESTRVKNRTLNHFSILGIKRFIVSNSDLKNDESVKYIDNVDTYKPTNKLKINKPMLLIVEGDKIVCRKHIVYNTRGLTMNYIEEIDIREEPNPKFGVCVR